MEDVKNISYHDATILDMYRSENDLVINLDDVHIGNSTFPVSLTCHGVKKKY